MLSSYVIYKASTINECTNNCGLNKVWYNRETLIGTIEKFCLDTDSCADLYNN